MNHLQETALNHVKSAGLLGNGFGSMPELCKKNLIWVVTRMQVVIDRYPTCGAAKFNPSILGLQSSISLRRELKYCTACSSISAGKVSGLFSVLNISIALLRL
ncbi:palmitoyl-acyl carrier protein thioesterase, chloroplastic-like isoform X2 [Juglans microcarpa x Juglans regia]|uniref:palmitoyl-acyl carrier protein thioesterase, chloroplastic-like isoform X2 n=1 Tax=Juglans microcarpa x Juglans regia TaxID=2249226 RepID=UPI001B7E039D|nr:palmitoyl-acyl carrier protein thioesterase, chloroplastic-like isoform X2 [Juglans microcarpa x Juglans regia]